MLSQGQRWNNIHSLSLFLSVCAPFQNTFVGLTNLGATCYVNTFLQVWFHNLELRRSLYQCHNSRAQEHNIESGITETKYWRCFFMFLCSCFISAFVSQILLNIFTSLCKHFKQCVYQNRITLPEQI